VLAGIFAVQWVYAFVGLIIICASAWGTMELYLEWEAAPGLLFLGYRFFILPILPRTRICPG
jgi:hypothetical protein